ncbi:MAG: GtrA family protein [Patescibacteria group bacterium]
MRQLTAYESGRITRFLVVGGISVFTYYTLLYGLTEFAGVWYVVSAAIAFVVYYGVNFSLQKFWTFKNKDRKYVNQQLLQYSIMSLGNWILNTSLLYVLVEYLNLWYMLAQVILTVVVSIIAYFGFRWIFRHR